MSKLASQFMSIFSGLERAYGIYEIVGTKHTTKGIKKDGRGRTLQEPLSLVRWQQHLKEKFPWGSFPSRMTRPVNGAVLTLMNIRWT